MMPLRRPVGRITKAAAKLAYGTAFLLRSIFLPLEYLVHVAGIAIGSLATYLAARLLGPRVLVQGAQIDAPFSQTDQDKVYDWGVTNIDKYGLPLAVVVTLFSPLIALFTATSRTCAKAQSWGDQAYYCVTQEEDTVADFYTESENRGVRFSAVPMARPYVEEDNATRNNHSRTCRMPCFW